MKRQSRGGGALIAGALALVASILTLPAEAAADNSVGHIERVETPIQLTLYPPDMEVKPAGIKTRQDGRKYYEFKVANIGQGAANSIDIRNEVAIKRRADHSLVRKEHLTIRRISAVQPGESFVWHVPCYATSITEYCDYASITIADVDPINDQGPGANYGIINTDIVNTGILLVN